MKILKVKILKYSNPLNWYADRVGEIIEVYEGADNYFCVSRSTCYISKDNCIVVTDTLEEQLQAAKDNVLIIEKQIALEAEIKAKAEALRPFTKEEYEDTVALFRKQPGRKSYGEGIGTNNYGFHVHIDHCANVMDWNNCMCGTFQAYFKTRQDVQNAVSVVGKDKLIKAIQYEQNIGL